MTGLFLAMWFSWVGFTLYANRFDTDVIVLCCHESLLRRHCIERDLFGRYLGGLSPGGGVGTILCGSNTTTEDFARWVLGTAEPSRVAPAELHPTIRWNDNGRCWCD